MIPERVYITPWVAIAATISFWIASSVEAQKPRWTQVETPHFVVVTDAGAGSASRLARQFEEIRLIYMEAFPDLELPAEERLTIVAPKSRAGRRWLYGRDLKANQLPDGLFFSSPFGSYAMVREDMGRENLVGIVNHEYFHFIARDQLIGAPPWLREGLAEFWSSISTGSKQWKIGIAADRLESLQELGLISIERVLAMTDSERRELGRREVLQFYAHSWAIVHFLLLGEHAEETRGQLESYRRLCLEGIDAGEAARTAFGDLESLQRGIGSYTRRPMLNVLLVEKRPFEDRELTSRVLTERETAETLAGFLLGRGETKAARTLLEQASRLEVDSSRTHELLARIALEGREFEAAGLGFRRAVEVGEPSQIALYGHAVVNLLGGPIRDLEEAERVLLQALSFGASAPVLSRLAALYAELDEGPERALALVDRAVRVYPSSPKFRLRRAAILEGAGRTAEATVAVASVLQLTAGDAISSNQACWDGTLMGIAALAMPICEQSVRLHPDHYADRDTRGVARLAAGDLEGGLDDLRYALKHAPEERHRFIATRTDWVRALEAGRNPFDEQGFAEFRREPEEGGLLWGC